MRYDTGVQTLEIAGTVFTLRDVAPSDCTAVLGLHRRVFGSSVNAAWYDWKYQQGGGEAVGLWQGHELVAHCGGTPRSVLHHGRAARDLQIGDVMVAPEWRGVLTRRGPFYHVSERLYSSRLGPGKDFFAAFGFPNERHLRLAVKMGLSWDSGPVEALSWHGHGALPGLGWSWRAEALAVDHPEFDRRVNRAWSAMQQEASRYSMGVRDAAYLRWRFARRPDHAYRFVQLRRPWKRLPCGVVVLGPAAAAPNYLQWLDWVGPLALLPMACTLARLEAARSGSAGLTTWASPAVARRLADTGVTQRSLAAVLGVPKASDLTEEQVQHLDWWLMAGDTDFL